MKLKTRFAVSVFVILSGLFSAISAAASTRVLARWPGDGLWYPARVNSTDARGMHVAFDDGDIATVEKSDIRALDWKVGTRLQCNWQNKGQYYGGRIATLDGEIMNFNYDDGGKEKISVSRCRELQ